MSETSVHFRDLKNPAELSTGEVHVFKIQYNRAHLLWVPYSKQPRAMAVSLGGDFGNSARPGGLELAYARRAGRKDCSKAGLRTSSQPEWPIQA